MESKHTPDMAELFSGVVCRSIALLSRLDHMTTEEFGRGGERNEREELREAVNTVLARLAKAENKA